MKLKRFEEILNESECSILDFKKQQYDFLGAEKDEKNAEFIKDIISFANTKRKETAVIIIGIEELDDNTKILHGVDKHIDDAIFQQKIKDKVNPKPIFSYSLFDYKGKKYGVFEIPINYYSEPITPTKNMKGLEKGKVYFRRGTSNSEATVNEIISINDWFRSLEQTISKDDLSLKLSEMLNKLNGDDTSLAAIATEMLVIARKLKNDELIGFFNSELKGWNMSNIDKLSADYFYYRKLKVIVSYVQIQSVTTSRKLSSSELYNDLLSREESFENDLIYNKSVASIDTEYANMKKRGTDSLYSEKKEARELLKNKNIKGQLMLYYSFDNYNNLIENIKLKYKNKILKLIY